MHRPATIQRMRLGATADGKLTAFGTRILVRRSARRQARGRGDVRRASCTPAANRMTTTRLAELDLPEGNAMRAPGDAPGLDGSRNRHGRDGREAEDGSHRVPRAQRHAGGSREPDATVLAAAVDAVPAHRRREVRLEPAQCEAGAGARERVADRHRRGHARCATARCRNPRRACGSMPRQRHRRNRHDGHRHRHLHHHRRRPRPRAWACRSTRSS